MNIHFPLGKFSLLRICPRSLIAALIGLAVFSPSRARGDSVNSPNINMNVDTNRSTGNGAGNVAVTVNTITIAETMIAEYSSGAGRAITLQVKPGFQFDSTSNVTAQSTTIGFNNFAVNAVATVTPQGVANETITFTLSSGTNANVQDIIRINGIKLKILSAAGAAGPAQTTMSLTTSTAGGAFTNQGIVAASIAKGAANSLVFSAQPGTSQFSTPILPNVKIIDFGGNIINDSPRNITLALQANPGSATLNGTKQVLTSAGIAKWTATENLNIATVSSGYTLRASHDGAAFLTSDTVDSAPFDITAGAPDHLAITKQPVSTPAGGDILIDVVVQDSANNPVLTNSVSITLDSSVNPGGWPLLTDTSLTKTTVLGVASWAAADHLRITKAVNDYKLVASGLSTPVETDAFNITPADPSALHFVQQPGNTVAGVAFAPPVTVEVLDAFSNRTTASTSVQLNLSTAPCGGNLTGNSAAASSGLATFDTLSVDTGCTGDELEATATGLLSDRSSTFNVTGGANGCGVCGQGAVATMLPMMLIQMGLRHRRRSKRSKK